MATVLPQWIEPMAATLTDKRFADPAWTFERKLDGIRVLAYKNGKDVELWSRNRLRLTDNYPAVVAALAKLKVKTVILDGEATWAWGSLGDGDYYVFDILFLDGADLRQLPLEARRVRLRSLKLKLPVAVVP
jgi:ATP-dependent DNA ligase